MIAMFDMDNTITPYKQQIAPEMHQALLTLKRVWIVTSADVQATRFQLGSLFNEVERVYCCSGAELYMKGNLVHTIPNVIQEVQVRPNAISFKTSIDRRQLIDSLTIQLAGRSSILISAVQKHVVMEDVVDEQVWLWADELQGIDASLAAEVLQQGGRVFEVGCWEDTLRSIRNLLY